LSIILSFKTGESCLQFSLILKYNRAMKKARILLTLGVWIAILPYLGFPYSWKNILFSLTGLVLIFLAYRFYIEYKKSVIHKKEEFDNFLENKDFNEEQNTNENNFN